jgi:hypothetical protein
MTLQAPMQHKRENSLSSAQPAHTQAETSLMVGRMNHQKNCTLCLFCGHGHLSYVSIVAGCILYLLPLMPIFVWALKTRGSVMWNLHRVGKLVEETQFQAHVKNHLDQKEVSR